MLHKKVVDCFLFYNEVDMLQFRLKEHYDHVDYFVIVESDKSFTGNKKEFNFIKHKSLFKDYLDKIIYVKIGRDSVFDDPWKEEKHQRDCLGIGINKLDLVDKDIIIISDVDEILNVDIIPLLKEKATYKKGILSLKQDMYYYNLECFKPQAGWWKAKAVSYKTYLDYNSCEDIRIKTFGETPGEAIDKAGWHFTYFGDPEFISHKLSNFAHQEYNNDEFNNVDKIKNRIDNREDLFGRDFTPISYIKVEDNNFLPKNYKMLLVNEKPL